MLNEDFNVWGIRRKPWLEGTTYFAEAYSWIPGADKPAYTMICWNDITGERYVASMTGLEPPITKKLIDDAREIMMKVLKAAILGREVEELGPGEKTPQGTQTGPVILKAEGHA